MTDNAQTVIIDNGSGMIKCGFAGNENPSSVFPSIIGRLRCDISGFGDRNRLLYIGNEAHDNACVLNLKYPIEHGIVQNWDDMEKIWHHTFYNELKIDPTEHPVLITEAVRNPISNREKMIQLLFETFNVPSVSIFFSSYLSLIASGHTTGIVCDIGEGISQILPVYDAKTLLNSAVRINFGGSDLINFLQRSFEKCGYYFTTSEEKEIIRNILETKGYVAIDYDSEIQKHESTDCNDYYYLPDGNTISLSKERFIGPEFFFKPHMNGFEFDGIDKIIVDSISKCSQNTHKDLFENIVLSGGVSMLKGFPERIEKEIKNKALSDTNIRIIANPERKLGAWLGGSLAGTNPYFKQFFASKNEYEDVGLKIVQRFLQ